MSLPSIEWKRSHIILMIIGMFLGVGIHFGITLNTISTLQNELVNQKEKIKEIEVKAEALIEIKIDINYIKRDISDIKKSLSRN